MSLQEAEETNKLGKTLLEWAQKDPLKLEKMIEHEFDDDLREAMTLVYRVHVMGHKY